MNEYISYYELLRRVKEGKAPIKVEWDDLSFEFDGINYFHKNQYAKSFLSDYLSMKEMIEDDVIEIIEKQDELEEIKKLNEIELKSSIANNYNKENTKAIAYELLKYINQTNYKVNELIEKINNLEKKEGK